MKNYFDLTGQTAVVTGASTGLGVQMAKAFASQGANLVLIARRQNLLEENVPINDLATILETLADYGTVTKDTEVLTEYVRQGLRRTIANKYADENDRINVVTIHPKVEEMVSQSIQKTATGSYPVMKPDSVNKILTAIGDISQQMAAQNMNYVILTSPKIRLAFRKLIAFNFPDVAVLSLNEIPNEIAIESIGNIEI